MSSKKITALFKLSFTVLILFFSIDSFCQAPVSRYENDTVYTLSGFKVYNGLTLEFNKGNLRDGRFKYVTPKNGFLSQTLTNAKVEITKIKKFSVSVLGNAYVDLKGLITLKNGKREVIVLHMAFDALIENCPYLPCELKVPDEYRNTRPRDLKRELHLARDLYEDKVITKAEYTEMKKKIEELPG